MEVKIYRLNNNANDAKNKAANKRVPALFLCNQAINDAFALAKFHKKKILV